MQLRLSHIIEILAGQLKENGDVAVRIPHAPCDEVAVINAYRDLSLRCQGRGYVLSNSPKEMLIRRCSTLQVVARGTSIAKLDEQLTQILNEE